MTTRFKTSLAAAVAVVTMATAAPMLMADTAAKATASGQDQPQRRQGPGMGGPGGPGGPGMRRGGPGGPGFGPGPGFRGLDLTDDQKAQLRQINNSHAAEFKAIGERSRAAHEGMRQLVEADSINESAIRAKSAEVAAVEADAIILQAKIRKESMQILTAEQLAKLKEQRDNRGPRQRKQ